MRFWLRFNRLFVCIHLFDFKNNQNKLKRKKSKQKRNNVRCRKAKTRKSSSSRPFLNQDSSTKITCYSSCQTFFFSTDFNGINYENLKQEEEDLRNPTESFFLQFSIEKSFYSCVLQFIIFFYVKIVFTVFFEKLLLNK